MPALPGAPSAFFFAVPGTAAPTDFRAGYVSIGGATARTTGEDQNLVALGSNQNVGDARVRVISNTFVGTTTFVLFKNSAPTAISLVVPGGITGIFVAGPTVVSFLASDRLSWRILLPPGEPGGLIAGQISYNFKTKPGGLIITSEAFTGSGDRFFGVPASRDGVSDYPSNLSLTTVQWPAPTAMVINNVRINIDTNTYFGTVLLVLQVNGVDTPMAGSFAGTGVGGLGGSQPVAAGDLISFRFALPGGPPAFIALRVSFQTQLAMGGVQLLLVNIVGSALASFVGAGIDGPHITGTTESEVAFTVPPVASTVTNATPRVSANTLGLPATMTFRKNGADTPLMATIPPGPFTGTVPFLGGPVAVAFPNLLAWKLMTAPAELGAARVALLYEFI